MMALLGAVRSSRRTSLDERSSVRPRHRRATGTVLLVLGALLFTLIISLPVLAIFARVLPTGTLLSTLTRPIVIEALRLSALTTLCTLGLTLVLGTPIAYLLARHRFPGKAFVDSMIELPMVLPPAVAGIGLLMAFGRRGLVGEPLSALGITIGFTTAAVILAEFFVAAPFYVRAARSAFDGVDRELETVSRTLMCWARALGEFGATIMFAGSFQGRTQTMPLAIYAALESDLDAALVLSAILTLVSFAILLLLRFTVARLGGRYA